MSRAAFITPPSSGRLFPLAGHADDHAAALKNYKPFLVAPTGIEPVYRGPGRSRRIPESPFLYGFSRF